MSCWRIRREGVYRTKLVNIRILGLISCCAWYVGSDWQLKNASFDLGYLLRQPVICERAKKLNQTFFSRQSILKREMESSIVRLGYNNTPLHWDEEKIRLFNVNGSAQIQYPKVKAQTLQRLLCYIPGRIYQVTDYASSIN